MKKRYRSFCCILLCMLFVTTFLTSCGETTKKDEMTTTEAMGLALHYACSYSTTSKIARRLNLGVFDWEDGAYCTQIKDNGDSYMCLIKGVTYYLRKNSFEKQYDYNFSMFVTVDKETGECRSSYDNP